MVGCGGMWQGVGTCSIGGGRVWGHVTGVWVHGRGSGLVNGRRHVAGVGICGRVWGHVAGCGDMWHRWWQGVGACGRGLGTWKGVRPSEWTETCGRGGNMW